MLYKEHMDTTIRNLDEALYRRLKARAALEGLTIGELVNAAIRASSSAVRLRSGRWEQRIRDYRQTRWSTERRP